MKTVLTESPLLPKIRAQSAELNTTHTSLGTTHTVIPWPKVKKKGRELLRKGLETRAFYFLGLNKNYTEKVVSVSNMQMQALSAASFGGISKPVSAQIRLKSLYTPATFTDPSSDSMAGSAGTGPKWAQKTITLPPLRRGCHLVTPKVYIHYLSFCFPYLLYNFESILDR